MTNIFRILILLALLAGGLAGCRPASQTSSPSTPTADQQSATSPYWPTQDWRTSTPEQQGMDASLLAQAAEKVKQDSISLFSLLVIRNGYIVSETYFQGSGSGGRREVYSVTKSFTSTLVGIAVDQGLIDGVKPTVASFLPGRTFKNDDPRKQAMTLENVLTMNTGLDWVEGDPSYQKLYMSQDWAGYMLDLPMAAQPGTLFNYCSGCTHLLSTIVQAKSGDAPAFARKNLFEPLGITGYRWDTDNRNVPIGGWGLQLTPREMARLGYLFLHNGQWDGRQVVSSAWVQAATQKHTGTDGNLGYGYQWWIYDKYGAYAALGRYGQTIFVVPNLNLVIVTTALSEDNHDRIFSLIDNFIVPAVKE
jgi:CubicO group peptidase (beta-lactamase class C family)